MAEFSPSELDQIEDLLEDLEVGTGLEDENLSPAARERLDEYRDILALSRDALPLEEPDPNLLAGVIAEARQSAFNAKTTAAGVVSIARDGQRDESDAAGPSWFRRWLPAMALAASAPRPPEAPVINTRLPARFIPARTSSVVLSALKGESTMRPPWLLSDLAALWPWLEHRRKQA